MDFATKLYSKILLPDHPGECWGWMGADDGKGYGRFHINGTTLKAHSASYEHFYGENIPKGMFIDHRCRNRGCVKPDHLRIVTPKQNSTENANGFCAENAKKTHCPKGHRLSGENLVIAHGARSCRECLRSAQRDYHHRNKAERNAYSVAYMKKKRAIIAYLREG
jgi:hypothetical protein